MRSDRSVGKEIKAWIVVFIGLIVIISIIWGGWAYFSQFNASDWAVGWGATFEKRPNGTSNGTKNADSFRSEMGKFDYDSSITVNKYQKEQVEKKREKFIDGFKAKNWRGKVTKIGSDGEVKIDSEVSGIWLYFNISSKTKQVGNWRVGDNVVFSGKIGSLYFISYEINISEISRI